MKLLLADLLIRSVGGTAAVIFSASAIAAIAVDLSLFLFSPFVSDQVELQIAQKSSDCWDVSGKYFCYLILISIFGVKFHFKNGDLLIVEKELFKFNRSTIQSEFQ